MVKIYYPKNIIIGIYKSINNDNLLDHKDISLYVVREGEYSDWSVVSSSEERGSHRIFLF